MRKRAIWLTLLLPALIVSAGARRAVPMYEPPLIKIPDDLSRVQVAKAISGTVMGRGWVVDSKYLSDDKDPSHTIATLYVRKHSLSIRIEFDNHQVTFHYVRSSKLQYREEEGVRYIHPKYEQWLRNLEVDLKIDFESHSIKSLNEP